MVTYSERVFQFRKNGLLVLDMIDVLALNDLVLFHRLDRVLSVRVGSQPADLDETESALAEVLTEDNIARLDTVEDALSRCSFYHISTNLISIKSCH